MSELVQKFGSEMQKTDGKSVNGFYAYRKKDIFEKNSRISTMNEETKKNLKISLIKQDGKVFTSIPKATPENLYSRSSSAFDIAQKLRANPYQSEFIKFNPDCDRTLVENSETEFYIIYSKKDSEVEIGRVLISGNIVSEVYCHETDGKYEFDRKETFLKSGLLSKRQLLIYQKGNPYNTLIHFCYEVYRNGQIDFCATSINDLSISNGDGDFVRYIYNNGKVFSKEVFNGKEYRFKTLSTQMYLPPVIYSKGGNLKIRYILGSNYVRKETDFKRHFETPVMIVGSKNDLEKFVDLNSATSKFEPIMDLQPIMDGASCRVHLQEQYFKSYSQNSDNASAAQKSNSQESNNYIEYNVETEKIEETLRNLKADSNIVYGINVHGTIHLNYYSDSISLFSRFLQDPNLQVSLDLSECSIQNEKYLRFRNCFSLQWLALPKKMKSLRNDLFYKCNNLRYVQIPENISKIAPYIFEGCRNFKFTIGIQNISYKNLIYSKEQLETSSQFEVNSKKALYDNYLGNHEFDRLGFISLPKSFVNGFILTEQGKEFRNDVNLNITELSLLITQQAALVESRIVDSCYANEFSNSKTGAEAIKQLIVQNNVEEKYKDVIINNIPVIPYAWRAIYLRDGVKQNPYINSLYEDLVREIEISRHFPIQGFNDKRIQTILNNLAKNSIYRKGMWYLCQTKKTTITARDKDHLAGIIKETILKNGSNCDLNFIDVSQVTDMTGLFAHSDYNGDISEWDVSNVTSMENMFLCSRFSGNINDWNVNTSCSIDKIFNGSKMADMLPTWNGFDISGPISAKGKTHLQNLIYLATLKNGPHCDLNFIDVSNVIDMSKLFRGSSFNGDISKWNVSNVGDMSEMFEESDFTGDIGNWDVSNVTSMKAMFKRYKPQHNYFDESLNDAQFKIDISKWNVCNVRDMSEMFEESDFTGDISNWDVSNVTSMALMFAKSQFNNDISRWNVSNVTNMSAMFAKSAFTGNISNWDVSNVTDMCAMFADTQFNGDVNNWNVSKVTNMSNMFAASAFNGDISNWDVSNVTDMRAMFDHASFNGEIGHWNVSKVRNMSDMFEYSHFTGDISKWNVSNVTDMSNMFCKTVFNADVSKWDVSKVNDFHCMFYESYFTGDVGHWIVSKDANVENMFLGSELEDLGLIPYWYHKRNPLKKEASSSFDLEFEDD